MYPHITITNETELQSEEWRFIVFDFDIVLDSYQLKKRETKRHKFQTEKSYDRIGGRSYGYGKLNSNEVPMTEEIKAEAKQKFVDKLKVCLWEERGK